MSQKIINLEIIKQKKLIKIIKTSILVKNVKIMKKIEIKFSKLLFKVNQVYNNAKDFCY